MYRGSTWNHLNPHDALRLRQRRVMVGRVGFMMGGSKWCQPYVVVQLICGLVAGCLCVGYVACVQDKVGQP